jgi:hypothetical protein
MKVVAKPIQMVAWFNEKGNLTPVRFKLCDEDGVNSVIKIDKIIFMDKEKLAGNQMFIYRCQSIFNGIDKIYEIKYELSTCKWMLFKM